jgi:Rad3-related DNA helicase
VWRGILGYCNPLYLRGTLQQGVDFIEKRLSMVCFVIVDGLGFQS